MKKHIKKGVTIILMFCLALVTMFSVSAESPEITPFYNNTKSASVFAKVDKDGELTISYLFNGYDDRTTKVVITTYIEKKVLGLFWTRVDNGQPNEHRIDTIYISEYYGSRTFKLTSNGTYRVKATYVVYGSGGSADNIPCENQVTY